MLNAPLQEKRQRVEPAPRKMASGRAAESDWDDDVESSENDNENDNENDAEFDVVKRAPPAKLKVKAPPKKKQTKTPLKIDAGSEMLAPAKRVPKQAKKSAIKAKAESKSAPVKKKARTKKVAAAASSSDNGGASSDDSDGNGGSDDGDVEVIENPATKEADGDKNSDGSASPPAGTPLSHIWTEHAEDSNASGESKTLVYKQDFVWDDALFTNNDDVIMVKKDPLEEHGSPARDRPLGKRQMRSVQQSHIRQNLMMGNLDPHTMVQCEAYRSKDEIENPMNRSRGSSNLEPPFQVQVHPDAVFVCDLHAHLATCEIIGFLGGRWDEATKTLYIQAAFPCRSLMIDGDDGSTDVEMDPGSEIELREIIQNAELEVVGWYHSHPAFAPDPSIRDIENQTSYQQLFQRRIERQHVDGLKSSVEISEPFVGLIVGTYDTKRDTPVSLFRYFHTRGEKVSGGARREIYMPYELVPTRRQYRSVLSDERRAEIAMLTMYPTVFEALFGKQFGAVRLRGAEVAIDRPQIEFAGIDSSPATSSKNDDAAVASTKSRKRKPSVELLGKEVNDVKKVKGRRGRPPRTGNAAAVEPSLKHGESVVIDAVGASTAAGNESEPIVVDADEPNVVDVVDPIVVDASEPADTNPSLKSSSVKQGVAVVDAVGTVAAGGDVGDEKEPIVVDADDSVNAAQLPPRAPEVVVVDLSSLPPSSSTDPRTDIDRLVNLPEPEKPESPEGSGSSQASSTASVSGVLDSAVGITGGRRRGRKPVQTQRKTTMFTSQSTKSDDPSLVTHTAMASQFAVYGAFGTVSGISTGAAMPDRKETSIQVSDRISPQTTVKVESHSGSQKSEVKSPPAAVVESPRPVKEEIVLDTVVSVPSEANLVPASTTAGGTDATKEEVSNAAMAPGSAAESQVIRTDATAGDVVETVKLEIASSDTGVGVASATEAEPVTVETLATVKEEIGAVVDSAPVALLDKGRQVKGVEAEERSENQETRDCIEDAVGDSMSEIVRRIEADAKEAAESTDTVTPESVSEPAAQTPGVESHTFEPAALSTVAPQSAKGEVVDTGKVVGAGLVPASGGDATMVESPQPVVAGVEDTIARVTEAEVGDVVMIEEQPPVKEKVAAIKDASASVAPTSEGTVVETPQPVKESPQHPVKGETVVGEASAAGTQVLPTSEDVSMVETQQSLKEVPTSVESAVAIAHMLPESEDVVMAETHQQAKETAVEVAEPLDSEVDAMAEPQQRVKEEVVTVAVTDAAQSAAREDVVMVETPQSSTDELTAVEDVAVRELPPAEAVAPPVVAPQPVKEIAGVEDGDGDGVDAAASGEDVVMAEMPQPGKEQVAAVDDSTARVLLFGKDRQVEDIRTSLAGIEPMVARMREEQRSAVVSDAKKPVANVTKEAAVAGDTTAADSMVVAENGETEPTADTSNVGDHELSAAARQEAHLLSLRTKYGSGISGCAEQVITLVDYYCKFERRIDLNEPWKARVSKLSKIAASMAEYVRYVNVPVHLRQDFVQVRSSEVDAAVSGLDDRGTHRLYCEWLAALLAGCGGVLGTVVEASASCSVNFTH